MKIPRHKIFNQMLADDDTKPQLLAFIRSGIVEGVVVHQGKTYRLFRNSRPPLKRLLQSLSCALMLSQTLGVAN